jgi:WD40 repeat protein
MKLLVILLVYLPVLVLAQNQANIWYFGNHAGLDFNSGSPVALNNGQVYLESGHAEGTSVICDNSGDLLFYTNGQKVWNQNHVIMENGDSLMGSFSATQSSLILPLPGSDRYFYLFTLDDFNNNLQNGFRYSVIDMCLDNGLGEVVKDQKNILVLDGAGEKMTAVKHQNGTDYWVIVHKYYSDEFYAYHLSSAGISAPVITAIGSVHTNAVGPPSAAIGYMKASPSGEKIAVVSHNGGQLRELFDFNSSTGVLSNFVNLHTLTDATEDAYGLSFSPDNSKLYLTYNLRTVQYDLSAGGGDPDAIRNSKIIINPTTYSNNHGLQLGPDGKIYVTQYGEPYLNVIENPNAAGMACNYIDTAIYLVGDTSNFGLPNLLDSYAYTNSEVICPVGISEELEDAEVSVYPNPTSDYVTIQTFEMIYQIQIFDISGKLVFSKSEIANKIFEIDISIFENGIYLLKTTSETGSIQCTKIIKQ